jgi:type I restriction enzyme S subunit
MIAEALRKSILQAAIQGKLTEQLPEDGDAGELLEEIKAEKKRLIREGKIKKENPLPEIAEEEIPFEIPENWCWVRLGNIIQVNPRNKIEDNILVSFMPMTLLDDGYSNSFSYEERLWKQVKSGFTHFADNDVVVAKITPCFQNRKSAVMKDLINGFGAGTTELHVLRPINDLIISEYVLYLVKTEYFIGDGVLNMTGTAGQQRVGKEYIQNLLCPLPPKNEQVRIFNKVVELLSKVKKLYVDEEKLETLQKSFPKRMKDSLLQAAIQGKLTEQMEADGDAQELVVDIQKEKERLIKEGKIKKEKALPEIAEDEIPFEIPENWCWVRLGTIIYNHGQKCPENEFTYIDISSINNKANTLGALDNLLQPNEAPSRARKIVHKGDVIYATVRPYLHNICVIDREIKPEPIVSTGFAVVCTPMPILNQYLFRYFLSPAFDSYANDNDNSKGVAYPAINDDKFSKALVPLPPLSEQQRIVERLEQLMPLCDALE